MRSATADTVVRKSYVLDKIDVAQFLPFRYVDNIVDEDVESDIVAQEMVALA